MSDRPQDPWREGPGGKNEGGAGASGQGADSAATSSSEVDWQARERTVQLEMMDRWVQGVVTEQRRSRRWKLFFRFLFALLFIASIATSVTLFTLGSQPAALPGERHLGVVRVKGVIEADGEANAERIIKGLRAANESPASVAVVLDINSPGGSPVQSQRVYDELMRMREQGGKPVIAVIEDLGASGAYYMAAGAGEILAAPSSLVGSIGVISSSFGLKGPMEELGIERRVFTAGDNKAFLDPFSEISPEQRDFWQNVLATTHQQFIAAVKAGRGERLKDDPALFSGLIWTGEQARALGLVDRTATLEELAAELAPQGGVHDYTPRQDPFERFTRRFAGVMASALGLDANVSPVSYRLP
ncbi:signal peptide peptidase SppA [Cobetia sp. 14N.309.X.WAT.E.A4]|uniref:signal peptide peptidase SppA n=1 Tax=Cobetia sp. 14N.309.X.WAT.E.A4 TaxID=2998323 RepID=UPI0025B167AC|nr:signal peptide peptidase SppA [Cobetia sp. 14N.309.X.WAT.E.A4]MDN2655064.1 signal peptide peptidase SppA [Cobetia sp. 14N.309.X.WAT.E.A4]